jgi:hypothetical protein
MHLRRTFSAVILSLLVMATVGLAQGGSPRDPEDLARRYLRYVPEATPEIPDLPEPFESGVTTATFRVPQAEQATPVQITARLGGGARAESYLPGALVWVDERLPFNQDEARSAVQTLAALFATLSLRSAYGDRVNLTDGSTLTDVTDTMPVPDIDQDGLIHVVFTRDLPGESDAIYNANDSLPVSQTPGAFGNQRDVIFVNAGPYVGVPYNDPLYANAVLTAYLNLVLDQEVPDQSPWLRNLLVSQLRNAATRVPLSEEAAGAFLASPETSILALPGLGNAQAVSGAQGLFTLYLQQRFGSSVLQDLYLRGGDGITAVDAALAQTGVTDPVTGAVPTMREVFADFAVTSAVNFLFGDGRYAFVDAPVQENAIARAEPLTPGDEVKADVAPFAFRTYYINANEAQAIRLSFEGAASRSRLGLSGDRAWHNAYFWAPATPDIVSTLTTPLDLSASAARLTFDAWHNLGDAWNYAYVSVSTDGGSTWEAQPVENMTFNNMRGVAYGPGLTGISSSERPRPFPIIGIIVGADGQTVAGLSPGGAAQAAGLEEGDVLLGADGTEWQAAPNILALLANYAPGDVVNLMVSRQGERIDIPVTLGAHPTRRMLPQPVWQTHAADLSRYAGQLILLRFELVTMPGQGAQGTAIANIRLNDESLINGNDPAAGWDAQGWIWADDAVEVEWLVQTVTTGDRNTRMPSVSRMVDGDVVAAEQVFSLAANETLIVIVAAVDREITAPAAFTLIAFSDEN